MIRITSFLYKLPVYAKQTTFVLDDKLNFSIIAPLMIYQETSNVNVYVIWT